MLSKLMRCPYRQAVTLVALKKARTNQKGAVRGIFGLVPPNQYDTPFPKRLNIFYTMRVYWETIPLVVTTIFAFSLVILYLMWCCRNKMEIVFSTHSRRNISRTMDLRYPSVHKLLIINQRYEPWPEMQDVLDKMIAAEKRNLVRLESCSFP